MYDALRVCRLQSVGNLDRQAQQLFDLERISADYLRERLPLQQLHDNELLPLMLLDRVKVQILG